jgi:hypothetical protein
MKKRRRISLDYIERTSVGNTECSLLFVILCSARVSEFVIVLSEGPFEKIGKWDNFVRI